MRAKVKPDVGLHVVTACAGVHFTDKSWQEVPSGREEEALNNPYLVVDLGESITAENVVEEVAPPPTLEPDFETIVLYDVDTNASEAARTLAGASGISLLEITGTGRDGKITVTDVRNAIKEADDAN